MKLLRAAVLCVFAAAAPFAAASAQDAEKTLEFKDFSRISISGIYHLDVDVGGPFEVTLSGPAEEMGRVEAAVKGGVLKLGQRERLWTDKHNKGRHEGVVARISMPALDGLHMSGVVDGEVRGVDSAAFDVAISGVGEMRLHGACARLDAEVSGVGELDAEGLRCADVRVVVSGVGEATVFAAEAVDAVVSGMGDITVHGQPKRVKKSGGLFAEISIRD